MKPSSLIKILAGLAISTVTLNSVSQPVIASPEQDKFFCAELDGKFRTFARTERGSMIVLTWVHQISEEWTPRSRCIEVSQRFQKFYDREMLRFVSGGEVNHQPVLCAISNKGDSCNQSNVLVTLPPKTNSLETARQLMSLRDFARGRDIEVSGNEEQLATYVEGKTYYDLNVMEQLVTAPDASEQLKKRLVVEELIPIGDRKNF